MRNALTTGWGGTGRLVRLVGQSRAMELLLTARLFSAQEAQAIGLIHRVVPGNYLGQNDGRITDISESEITLVEIISDGIGGYIERDAAISLSD